MTGAFQRADTYECQLLSWISIIFRLSVEVSSNWLFKTPKLIGILVLTEGQTVNKQKS